CHRTEPTDKVRARLDDAALFILEDHNVGEVGLGSRRDEFNFLLGDAVDKPDSRRRTARRRAALDLRVLNEVGSLLRDLWGSLERGDRDFLQTVPREPLLGLLELRVRIISG